MKRSTRIYYLLGVVPFVGIASYVAYANFSSAARNGNEAAAVGSLRAITKAQEEFREEDRDGNGTLEYSASLAELATLGLIPSELGDGEDQGYRFDLRVPSKPDDQFVWTATADPLPGGGDRHFGTNMAGIMFFNATESVVFGPYGSSSNSSVG